jgi:hypothetical protein
MAPIARAAFDGALDLTKSSLLCFTLHSPTSKAMFPDIVRGDFGFPTVCLKNSQGTVYRFARGNLKDFFDIERPNTPQRLALPVGAFVYDRDLKANIPDNGAFFEHPVTGLYFDFLCHPTETIDIVIDGISLEAQVKTPSFAIQDLVLMQRIGQAGQFPAFSTETAELAFAVSLSNAGTALNCAGAILSLAAHKAGAEVQKVSITLKSENSYIRIRLSKPGHYTLSGSISQNGEVIAASSWPVCRVVARAIERKQTVLGISDAYEYDRIAAAGGSWDRIPAAVQTTVETANGIRFADGADVIPKTRPPLGTSRVLAAFNMPRWLSRLPDAPDYYRYRPTDWRRFADLIRWQVREMKAAGVTHYEVWNEASTIGHWNDNFEDLVELHRVSYETVKSESPEIVVLGGCTHSWTFDFIRKFLEAGGAQFCDGLAVHGYTYQPWQFVDQFDQLEALMSAYRPDFKAYITEIGFRYPAFTLDDQAKFLALYTLEAASRSSIAAILWFRFISPRPEILSGYRQDSSMGYNMTGHGGSYCRPSFAAYRFVERLLHQFDNVRASGPSTARRYEFVKDGAVEAVGLYQPQGEPELPAGWTVLDQYGAPLDGHADLRVAVSPASAHLLR